MHNLSEFRRNKNNTTDYSMMTLQTSEGEQQALIYSPNKRKVFLSNQISRTPVKIQKFSTTTDGEKLIINKMSIISSPCSDEYCFQYEESKGARSLNVSEVIESFGEFKEITMKGTVVRLNEVSVVGKGLRLRTGFLRDKTETI